MRSIQIRIDPLELVIGNRSAGCRAGVVTPEAGISWVDAEIENLPNRPQDKFNVRPEDIETFRRDILPFWKGKSLEDRVKELIGEEIEAIGKVAKINQTDHAQGTSARTFAAGWNWGRRASRTRSSRAASAHRRPCRP